MPLEYYVTYFDSLEGNDIKPIYQERDAPIPRAGDYVILPDLSVWTVGSVLHHMTTPIDIRRVEVYMVNTKRKKDPK